MLTREDLQQIGNVLDARIEAKLAPILDAKLEPIKQDLQSLHTKVDNVQKHLDALQATVIEFHGKLEKRVERVERHVGFTYTS